MTMASSRIAETTPWWAYPDQMAALFLYLVEHDKLDHTDKRAVVRVLEKPWAWSREHAEMTSRRTANDADHERCEAP